MYGTQSKQASGKSGGQLIGRYVPYTPGLHFFRPSDKESTTTFLVLLLLLLSVQIFSAIQSICYGTTANRLINDRNPEKIDRVLWCGWSFVSLFCQIAVKRNLEGASEVLISNMYTMNGISPDSYLSAISQIVLDSSSTIQVIIHRKGFELTYGSLYRVVPFNVNI